jgi:hypothetical protein
MVRVIEGEVREHKVSLLAEFKRDFEYLRRRNKAMMQAHASHEKFSMVTWGELPFNR